MALDPDDPEVLRSTADLHVRRLGARDDLELALQYVHRALPRATRGKDKGLLKELYLLGNKGTINLPFDRSWTVALAFASRRGERAEIGRTPLPSISASVSPAIPVSAASTSREPTSGMNMARYPSNSPIRASPDSCTHG